MLINKLTATGKINLSADLTENLKFAVNLTDKKYNLLRENSTKFKNVC